MRRKLMSIGAVLMVALFFVPIVTQAQKTLLKGVLLDSLTSEGEPFATIRVYQRQKADKPVAMAVTDMDGKFSQEVNGRGEFSVLFTSVGKINVAVPFSLNGQPVCNLDTIYIADDVQRLKGVEVVAQKPLVKMEVDKLSYNTADDVDAKSSTVLEMLRKVPMVTVDGNDNITVNGSGNFKVYVDGKPNVMISSNPSAILKNMPASSVKNIEVITNPGVKYDAEGVGGVLNLVTDKIAGTKSGLSGYNATIRGMASTKGLAGGVYFSMQKDKLSMTLNGNIANGHIKDSKIAVSREQFNATGNTYLDNSRTGKNDFAIKMGNLSLGYEIDSLRLLSASFGLMGFGDNSDFNTLTSMRGGVYGDGFGYTGRSTSDQDNYSINGSVDYQRSFVGNKDRMLTFSYLISSSPSHTDAYNLFDIEEGNTFLNLADRHTDGRRNTLENTFQMDYTSPLGRGQLLNVGMKYISRNNYSDSKYYLNQEGDFRYDAGNSLDYKHYNDILAAYAEYDGKWRRWGLKGGLRYEYTWQHVKYVIGQGEDFSLDYGNLVPSANLSYTIGERQNAGLTYNMRISRPGIGYLNPYVDRSDPTSVSYGNTDLECEKAHNISMVYNLFTPKWIVNLTLRQSFCDNAIESYSFYQDNILNTTYGNIAKNRQTGLNTYVNWNAGKNTRLNLNGGVSYVDLRSAELDLSNNGWQGNMMLGVQQTLPWDIRLSVNLISSTKQYNLQGWSTGFNALMGSLSRTFLKDRLSVSLTGMTNLAGGGLEFKSYARGKDFVSHSSNIFPVRNLSVSVSYTFGKQQTAKTVKRTIQNTDVKDTGSRSENIGTMLVK